MPGNGTSITLDAWVIASHPLVTLRSHPDVVVVALFRVTRCDTHFISAIQGEKINNLETLKLQVVDTKW
jgi:hypothetical protein